ncbi:MAG: DUF72 domain-containing protein [Nitrospirota bacterium]|nr:DUF72 domain-containing protein [Nitrospirota bacterium]
MKKAYHPKVKLSRCPLSVSAGVLTISTAVRLLKMQFCRKYVYYIPMIRIGTCSWTEKTLIQSGEFYPRDARTAEARLRYYAGHFDTVEVDSTYYAIPALQTTSLWAERTPQDFIFHIKAYGALTGHGIAPGTLPEGIRSHLPEKDRAEKHVYIKERSLRESIAERFRDALLPLQKANKLGLIVFQFPPWFHCRTANMDFILQARELMKGLPMAIEFRHGSWLTPEKRESVLHFLRENRLTYISTDEPQYGSLATVPFLAEHTTQTAYFRFHGRNKENWLKKGIETSLRYAYLYSDGEIKEFKKVIKHMDSSAQITYAMFNNCYGNFAVRNAMKLKGELARG